MRNAGIAALILLSACAPSGRLIRVDEIMPAGRWSGKEAQLEISPNGQGRVMLPCAVAEFTGPLRVDIGGHFLTVGHLRSEQSAGPRRQAVPANISGRIDPGGTLWLDVATQLAYPVRSAQLRRGGRPTSFRCL